MFNCQIILFTIFTATVIAFENELHYNRKSRQADLIQCETSEISRFSNFVRILMVLTFIFYILIMLGLIKAIIGCCCFQAIGICGLRFLVQLPRTLTRYHERYLKDFEVVYDNEGWPVDPNTRKRVRPLNQSTQFCLNVVFFLVIPFAFIHHICKRTYRADTKKPPTERPKRAKGGMDMYSDEETENRDMNYVLQQMHKSEQSLRTVTPR